MDDTSGDRGLDQSSVKGRICGSRLYNRALTQADVTALFNSAKQRAQIEAMPRWRFVHEKDWCTGPNIYAIGFLWGRNFDATEGELIYRKRLLLKFKLKIWLERE
jgi:hypothetical protein